jgi:hypothetical protein
MVGRGGDLSYANTEKRCYGPLHEVSLAKPRWGGGRVGGWGGWRGVGGWGRESGGRAVWIGT